jgi:peptidoglycan L-alanyl-D-glutamate endopeptidase CwlK
MITDGVHSLLVKKITMVLRAMDALGFPMKIVQGVRTTAEQQKLYAQGRTIPGVIVTKADGVRDRSNHQADLTDGLGRAVDCAFLVGGKVSWEGPWALYGAACEAVGLVWGGGMKFGWHGEDRPHAQLPKV